jgi:ParB-like chromosome segregation protein Spo0J
MRDESYDDSQPIILGTWTGQDEPVCIDGHTRLKAATNVGIEEVSVYSYEFETKEDAFEYAVRLQSNRRNLTDGDLLHCIERLHQQRPRGGDRKSGDAKESIPQRCGNNDGRSAGAKRTADLLNISCRKVEQALTVIKHGTPETKDAVLKNEMSINGAYQKTQKERKQTEKTHTGENSKKKSIEEKVGKEETLDLNAWASDTFDLIGQQRLSALNELDGSLKEHLVVSPRNS